MSSYNNDKSKLTYFDPDSEAIEPVQLEEPADEVQHTLAELPTKQSKKRPFKRWLAVALVLLLVAVGVESFLLIAQSFQQHWVLGSLWTAALGLLVALLLVFVVREAWLLRRLKQRWQQQQKPSPDRLLAGLKHPDLKVAWQQIDQYYWSDEERIERFELDIVSRVDQQAQRLISKRSAEAAALVAVSPSSVADMVLLLWRSQRMMTDIARCYGIELGYWSRVRLWRQVLTNLAYAGISELAVDFGAQWLSAELMTKLSARAGQGLGAGLLTARLGYQVMNLSRPIPFKYCKRPGYGRLQKDLLRQLSQVVPSIYKRRSSTESR
ncbi:TIGR01620 family protein [Idiomarina seosinensis]|uniref:TIGR01620 family protein n=1 Tax=Idiomarina seosinensis TaxID=281739 RepID=A0A432ZHA7_9GAMM|nr:TIGR01620 family protein [Idiomarina seosinensis]RUO77407.1 TIGR01620 family protein [Idiomarina seosinensis]